MRPGHFHEQISIAGRIADELYGIQDDDLNYEELYENLVAATITPP